MKSLKDWQNICRKKNRYLTNADKSMSITYKNNSKQKVKDKINPNNQNKII